MLSHPNIRALLIFALFALPISAIFLPSISRAQSGFDRVIVDDGIPRQCINRGSSAVSMHLMRAVVDRKEDLFEEDKDAVIAVSLELAPASNSGQEATKHIQIERFRIAEYAKGAVTLASRVPILSQLPLSGNDFEIARIAMQFDIYAISQDTTFARIMSALADNIGSLPIPANPYTLAFQQASGTLSKIFAATSAEAGEARSPLGSDVFEFTGADDDCQSFFAQTGTKAFIMDVRRPSGNQIHIDEIGSYCFSTRLDTGAALYYSQRPSSGRCADANTKSILENPFLLFTVMATPHTDALATVKNRILSESLSPEWQSQGSSTVSIGEAASFRDSFGISDEELSEVLREYEPSTGTFSLVNFELEETRESVIDLGARLGSVHAQIYDANITLSRCKAIGLDVRDCI